MFVLKKFLKVTVILLLILLVVIACLAFTILKVPVPRDARTFPDSLQKYDIGKVLVLYYSLGGNTAEVAGRISHMTDGTLFKIETVEDYPSSHKLFWVAWQELKNRDYPEYKQPLPDIASYDVIFVGSPVWVYSVAPPVLSVITKNDFNGKTVIPFCTQGGNYGSFFTDFQKEILNANVMKGIDFSKVETSDAALLDTAISNWLKGLQEELRKD